MNSERDHEERSLKNTLEAETVPRQRTTRQVITQALVGALVGLVVGVSIIYIYRWFWNVEISTEKIMFLSIGFCIYCGVLSAWLGKRFWDLFGALLNHFSA